MFALTQKDIHHRYQKMIELQKVPRAKIFFRVLFFLFLILIFASVSAFPKEQTFIFLTLKEKKIRVEVARTESEKAKGLMFRESLGEDEGIIFVYAREEILSFWMKNTRIPLSIAFIDQRGRIVDIQDMEPFSLRTHFSARPAQYALEMNKGWFQRNGVGVGDFVKFPPPHLKTAISHSSIIIEHCPLIIDNLLRSSPSL